MNVSASTCAGASATTAAFERCSWSACGINITIAVQFGAVKTAIRYVPIRGRYVEAGSLAANAGIDDVRIRRAARELYGGRARVGLHAAGSKPAHRATGRDAGRAAFRARSSWRAAHGRRRAPF